MIRVLEKGLAACRTEAFLRPVRTDWAALSGEVRELEVAAGVEWSARCAAQGPLPMGAASITDAGELEAEFVIHVAVASRDEPATPRSVALALRNGLRRAEEWEVQSLAMPLLGTGPGALDPETACAVMRPLLEEFVSGGADRTVRVVASGDAALRAALETWRADPG